MVKMGRSGEGVEAEAIGNSGRIDTLMEGMDVVRILIGKVRKEKFLLLLKAMHPVFGKTTKGEVQVGKGIIKVSTRV